MKLVIGGAFQGKIEFAQKTYCIADGWVNGAECSWEDIISCKGVFAFHEFIRKLLLESENLTDMQHRAEQMADELYARNPQIVVVSNELGYGVVPMDKTDRAWRELTGRFCTRLAEHSEEVTRVICGLGMKLK